MLNSDQKKKIMNNTEVILFTKLFNICSFVGCCFFFGGYFFNFSCFFLSVFYFLFCFYLNLILLKKKLSILNLFNIKKELRDKLFFEFRFFFSFYNVLVSNFLFWIFLEFIIVLNEGIMFYHSNFTIFSIIYLLFFFFFFIQKNNYHFNI